MLASAVAGGCGAKAGDPSGGPDGGKADDLGGGGGGGDDVGGGTCDTQPCDLYDQCGCESGQACDLDSSALAEGGTICRGITSAGTSTASCDADEECAAGYGCFGDPGQCRKYCETDGDCGLGHCNIQIVYDAGGGDYQDVPGARVCTKACKADSAGGSGCPPDRACDFYWTDPNGEGGDDGYWYTDCRVGGAGGDKADCSANGNDDCQSGFGCFAITYTDETVKDECRQICIWTVNGREGDRSCAAGTCHELGGDGIVIGDTEYGACF
ncbi:MAG TPA: hypothetical protein VFU21_03815 [Kofleriaceae bacterium]|nr:hypothetical protein [Kofleriaceae bacterium]